MCAQSIQIQMLVLLNLNKLKMYQFACITYVSLYRLALQVFAVNECYYIYKDKYKYITVIDADEAIIPRQAYNQEL